MTATLKDRILVLMKEKEGLTDREITDVLLGKNEPQQSVNQACRGLMNKGIIKRTIRRDGKIGNYLALKATETEMSPDRPVISSYSSTSIFSEDNLKLILQIYLREEGWDTQIAWGRTPGIDINAIRGRERWIIEVKGLGSSNPMNVNYFLGVLAETLQRMEDPNAKYSIALPDVKQFRNLWNKLPLLAKKRTEITALFINDEGKINESM